MLLGFGWSDMKNTKNAIIWLCLAHLLADVYSGFLNPIMPFIAAKLGFSMAIATIIISISHIWLFCRQYFEAIFYILGFNTGVTVYSIDSCSTECIYTSYLYDIRQFGRKLFSSAGNGVYKLLLR